MRRAGYIVANELLAATPPGDGWHATVLPGDDTRSLVMVEWVNPNLEIAFESLEGITPIGDPWETPSAEVLALLASLPARAADEARQSESASLPAVDVTPLSETLSSALRRLAWPNARLLR